MPKIISSPQSSYVKVRFSREEIDEFNRTWPCSELRNRSYWFEFNKDGDLVDTNVPEHDDGSAALALSQDAWKFVEERNVV